MKAGTRLAVAALVVALAPIVVKSDFTLTILVFSFLLGMLAVSFNLIFGYTGQLSMFHAAAFGISAYATHLSMAHWGVSFWGGILVGAVLVLVLSVIVGAICFRFRLKEFYFAVVTLAFSEMARLVVLNWNSVTNGTLGIILQEKPAIWLPGSGLVKLEGTLMWYYVSLAALVLTVIVCWRLVNSWMGRSFSAIRLNDELGDTLGINVFRYKLAAFAVGNMIAAVAGALYAFFLGSIEPGFLSIDQSLAIVTMVLLGGRGAVAAPIIGALVLTGLPHMIHLGAEMRSIVYGAILILTILLMPQGIYGSVAGWMGRRHAV
jgi:branched-chain amino acid transport system permease protein